MRARRASTCPACRGPIHVGELIGKTGFWQHVAHIIERNRGNGDGRTDGGQ
jgi:hypothetical protein